MRKIQNTKDQSSKKPEARYRAVLELVLLAFGICSAQRGRLTSAFTGLLGRLAVRAFEARWRFVMRYRSATVADSHGLPLNLKRM